ncbi:MAG: TfoX/Sxy family protein [Stappiaceae bacterium]
MASHQSIVDHICEQMAGAGEIIAKKMFGEYGVYCGEKFVGVICNDTLFLKPTPEGVSYASDLQLAPAYEGARPSLVIPQSGVDNAEWLAELVAVTAKALPSPKKKNRKKKSTGVSPKS